MRVHPSLSWLPRRVAHPFLLLLAAIGAGSTSTHAAEWHVDASNPQCPGSGSAVDPYCAIGDAIQAASRGDRIVVAAGTYRENVDFLGKAITVESVDGPSATVIDGGGATSCVRFSSYEGRDSVLRGFTLQNGAGVHVGTSPSGTEIRAGLAVYVQDASPTIDGNWIVSQATSVIVNGGGVASYGGSPSLTGNVIRGGHAELGGGVYCLGGSPALIDNDVSGYDAAFGAGVYLKACVSPLLASNRVHDNGTVFYGYASGPGPGVYAEGCTDLWIRDHHSARNRGANGGGVSLEQCVSVWIVDAEFRDDAVEWEGGAISAWMCVDVSVVRAAFVDCGAKQGGAVFAYQGTGVTIEDSAALRCTTSDYGAVVELSGAHAILRSTVSDSGVTPFVDARGVSLHQGARMEDCLVAGNDVGVRCQGGAIRRSTITASRYDGVEVWSMATIESSVIYGNGQVGGGDVWVIEGTADVSYSLVGGGYPGPGNLDGDPQFVDPSSADYRLRAGSPGVEAGRPDDDSCGVDVAGRPRRVAGQLTHEARIDMGAHEFSHVDLRIEPIGPLRYRLVSTGTAGLSGLLIAGVSPGSECLPPAGTLLVDPRRPTAILPWPPLPSRVEVSIPPAASGESFVVQQIVLGRTPGTANLSGAATIVVE